MVPKPWWQNCPESPSHRRRMLELDREEEALALADDAPELAIRQTIGELVLDEETGVADVLAILDTIGGRHSQPMPFPLSPRLAELPMRDRMVNIVRTLDMFAEGGVNMTGVVDIQVLSVLGATTPPKAWLAASLAHTIRAQLDI